MQILALFRLFCIFFELFLINKFSTKMKTQQFTLEQLQSKLELLLVSPRKPVKGLIKNAEPYIIKGFDKTSKYYFVKQDEVLEVKSDGTETFLSKENFFLTSSEKEAILKEAAIHMIASRLKKYHNVFYSSVLWALNNPEKVPENWVTPLNQ